MKCPRPTTVDFETQAIAPRPMYPPVPVGVSIKPWGKKAVYHAWGHASDNTCTKDRAIAMLRAVWHEPDGLLFQNCRFDLDVAEVHLGLKPPTWDRAHDTLLLLFLDDPHQRELGLKPSAARLLGMPPDERDAIADWLLKHQPVPDVKIGKSDKSGEPPGKYISYAPGKSVVAAYANGDTERTEALFKLLYPRVVERGMLAAYDRERRLSPILLDMERRGIRVDLARLEADVARYGAQRDRIDAWLRKRLKIGLDVNLNSAGQLLDAMAAAGVVDTTKMGITKTGKVKTDKTAMAAGVTDKVLAAVLQYDTQLATCLNTFMTPWLATARQSGGLIYTTWHATRSPNGNGTRTGRFSSTPNFQNMPKEFGPLWAHEEAGRPKCPWPDLLPLPLCRSYIVPHQKRHTLAGRDWSQQEPRILAHYEDGQLKAQYQADPWIDFHDNTKANLEKLFNRPFKRKPVKNIGLGIIYGEGVAALALKNGESYDQTKKLRDAVYAMYPGLKAMYNDMRLRAKTNLPITTWGGRQYFCEPPAIINGRIMEFDYKLVNVLIQGSAADCIKEAIIRYYAVKPDYHFLILTVHDELVLSLPATDLVWGMELLRQAMESVEFDVSILSEGEWSLDNWAAMQHFDRKGKRVPVALPRQMRRTA